jgi:hypothetical protein
MIDVLKQFWPVAFDNITSWSLFDKLRYTEQPTIPIIGESPFYEPSDFAWHMENIHTVYPHTKRFRAMRAICKNDLKELKKVLDDGFDLEEAVDKKSGKSCLGLAAFLERPLLVHYLLLRGASTERPDKLGNTPLMDAVERANLESLVELVEHGADPTKANLFSNTPLRNAENKRMVAVENFLRAAAKTPAPPKFPSFDIRFRIETLLDSEPSYCRKRVLFAEGANYPFNSLSNTYLINLFSEVLVAEPNSSPSIE